MLLKALSTTFALMLPSVLYGAVIEEVSGIWVLNGPGTESDILLTEEGSRLRGEYDLLTDDPSLSCIPASASRVWANPGSRVKIEITEDTVFISYELFDLRREIPIGDQSMVAEMPSTKNLAGTYFQEMGSSYAELEEDQLRITSSNHSPGYIRTSRGIPQGPDTVTIEVLEKVGDALRITHTYTDQTLYEQPIVLEYFLSSVDATDLILYECTESDYDWFNELNAN
jgi:hypothetical protein